MTIIWFDRHRHRPREKCPDFSKSKNPDATIVPADQLIDNDDPGNDDSHLRKLPSLTDIAFRNPDNFLRQSKWKLLRIIIIIISLTTGWSVGKSQRKFCLSACKYFSSKPVWKAVLMQTFHLASCHILAGLPARLKIKVSLPPCLYVLESSSKDEERQRAHQTKLKPGVLWAKLKKFSNNVGFLELGQFAKTVQIPREQMFVRPYSLLQATFWQTTY
jgi:hypothetical protein